jgi:hypothetical protein
MVIPVRPCACCGNLTIIEEYDICPVCFWQADLVHEEDPRYAGGANEMSLLEAQRSFEAVGAISPRWLKNVRPPLLHELPPSA